MSKYLKQAKVLKSLILYIHDQEIHAELQGIDEKAYSTLISTYNVPRYDDLEQILPPEGGTWVDLYGGECDAGYQVGNRSVIFLDPPEGEIDFAILTGYWDFCRSQPDVSLYLGLFTTSTDEYIQAVGFRYETPEISKKHGYFHVQPTKEFRAKNIGQAMVRRDPFSKFYDDGLENCWLPVSDPTIPARANTPVDLLLCLLVSLYGTGKMTKILNEISPYGDSLLNPWKEDFLGKPEMPRWYLVVEVDGTPQRYIKVISDRNGFRNCLEELRRNEYDGPNQTVKRIMKHEFEKNATDPDCHDLRE